VLRSDYRSWTKDFLKRELGTTALAEDPRRDCVGEIVGTKVCRMSSLLGPWLVAIGLLSMSGCGSSNSTGNVVTVTVSSSVGTVLILGESTTLTATVGGATNTNVTWEPGQPAGPPQTPCTYSTTTTDSTGKSTTAAAKACPADGSFGTLTNVQVTGTATYTAPSKIPDQTTFPGLQIIFTAQSQADTKKSGTLTITLDSGVSVVLTPNTATVPTNEPQSFSVQLTNDLQAKGVTWLITQQVPTTTTPYPQLKTCSPTCGTITPDSKNPNMASYTAPASVPTSITPADSTNKNSPANLTIVATSVADNTRLAIGSITIIAGGPINFTGISPTIAPQGAAFWDIYLNAPNISSASQITLSFQDSANPNNFIKTETFSSTGSTGNPTISQIKVLFPIPITTTTNGVTTVSNPQSTGARLRLVADDLVIPKATGTVSVYVSVTDPGQTVTPAPPTKPVLTANPYTFQFVPVRPTSIATLPDDVIQGKASEDTQVIVDGGYFGPGDQNLTDVVFQGTTIAKNGTTSNARQLNTLLPANLINASGTPAGLYPLSVSNRATPAPFVNNDAVTNIALFPDFSVTPPVVVTSSPGVPAGTNPSAVDIDPILGVLAVADPGSNTVRFFSIVPPTSTTPATLTLLSTVGSTPQAPLNLPTGLSVNQTNHTVAIVNYGSQTVSNGKSTMTGQTVTVLNIPNSPSPITPFFVDISNALQGSVSPAPMPYSIGVDPDSNLAVVAYSNTSATSGANLGFIINLNPNTTPASNMYGCVLGNAINSTTLNGQCLSAQVTLNTGQYPQIAVSRHGHVALVTPGGSGVVRGVNVTKPSAGNVITSASLTAGTVTVTVDTTKPCPLGIPEPPSGTATNPCPLTLIPGNAGSVLIAGLVAGTAANNALFNGVFSVNVTSSTTFTYVVNSTVSDSATAPSGTTAAVFYGSPGGIFSISSTAQGVAINPITNTAAIADANAIGTNGPQIDLLSALDQSISSISFFATCTAFTTTCSNAPELLGTTDVAWQPYTNALVSYNPTINEVSVSDPVSRKRYAFATQDPTKCSPGTPTPTGPSPITLCGAGTATLTVQNGTINTLTLFGGLAVDPSTNQAFVVKSGTGTIDIVDLGSAFTNTAIKSAHINELLVPSAPPAGCPQPTPGNPIVSGIPSTVFPQGTLTSSTDLCGVQIFGSGFLSGGSGTTQVRLDSTPIPAANVTVNSPRQLTITIPKSFLTAPHKYALDVLTSGGTVPNAQSNATDFYVVQAVDMSTICTGTNGNPTNTQPSSVAIAEQLANGPFSPIAVVSNSGCNSISVIDINPTITSAGVTTANPNFGQFLAKSIGVGTSPEGIAISQRYGLAVVANNGSATASVIDLTANPPAQKVPDVATGTNPVGVAVNEATGAAIVANNGSNTITMLNLGLLFPAAGTTPPTTLTPTSIGGIQSPIAVAIDPDRGTNNQGIAVVTSLQLVSGQAPLGALAVVEIGLQTPVLSTTIPSGSVTATPTGIVFDPFAFSGTANPGLFYANSSGSNVITAFNPDTGSGSSVNVGINPTSLAVNPQTGGMLTSNSASNTISIVDTLSNPLKTRQTFGIPGSPTFGVAVDQFTNLAVIVDQANNRVLLFPMPN
jgi:DNA-binding beta-propeller fold protein YncE